MDVSSAQWPQIGPCYRIEIIVVELAAAFDEQLGVEIQYFEQNDNIRVVDFLSELIDDEFLVPIAVIHTLYSQVIHFGAHWQDVIRLNACNLLFIFALFASLRWDDLHHVGAFSVGHPWSVFGGLLEVLGSLPVNYMDSHERMQNVLVHLQDACALHSEL